jgi:hypothetical protein
VRKAGNLQGKQNNHFRFLFWLLPATYDTGILPDKSKMLNKGKIRLRKYLKPQEVE